MSCVHWECYPFLLFLDLLMWEFIRVEVGGRYCWMLHMFMFSITHKAEFKGTRQPSFEYSRHKLIPKWSL